MKVQPLNQTALQVSWSQPETIYHPPIMNYMISYSWTKNEDEKEKTFTKDSDKDLVKAPCCAQMFRTDLQFQETSLPPTRPPHVCQGWGWGWGGARGGARGTFSVSAQLPPPAEGAPSRGCALWCSSCWRGRGPIPPKDSVHHAPAA